MPEKLMAIILSLGLISGIGIAGTGSASAAPKPKPSPSPTQKSTLVFEAQPEFQHKASAISIPFCRIVTIVMPVAGFAVTLFADDDFGGALVGTFRVVDFIAVNKHD